MAGGNVPGPTGARNKPKIDSGTMCRNESSKPGVVCTTFRDNEVDVINPYPDVKYHVRKQDGSYFDGLSGYGRGKAQYRIHQNFAKEVCDALRVIGKEWVRRHPNGPRIVLGEGSLLWGGPHWPHRSHQTGYDVDILVGRNDGKEGLMGVNPKTSKSEQITIDHPLYSLDLTKEMIEVISKFSPLKVELIIFADARVKNATPARFLNLLDHRKHFHVRFKSSPSRLGTKIHSWKVPKMWKYGQ
jgi:hypothetical protein